jgi:hypothetical protein
MGMHANGYVFYGYGLGDLTDRDTWESTAPAWMNDEDRDWQNELAVRLGWNEVPFPDHLTYDWNTRSHEQEPDYQAYDAARKQRRLVLDAGPQVELDRYGHCDGEAAHYVAIKASVVRSTYDCVRLDNLTVGDDWDEQLARFMELLAFPVPPGGPGWHLTSDYG